MIEKDSISLAIEYFETGYKMHADGKLENAALAYRASINLYPTAKAYTSLGIVYGLQGKYDMAIEECKKAVELEPEFGESYYQIGSYMVSMGREEDAITWLEKAIEIIKDDSNYSAYYKLGKIYEKKGDWLKALRHFNKAITIDGNYEPAQNAVIKLSTLLN
jgi:tetratricopeptide (TPR) repeat protein